MRGEGRGAPCEAHDCVFCPVHHRCGEVEGETTITEGQKSRNDHPRACEWCGIPGQHLEAVDHEGRVMYYHRLCIKEARKFAYDVLNICSAHANDTEDDGCELIFDRDTWTFRIERTHSEADFQHKEMNFLFKK